MQSYMLARLFMTVPTKWVEACNSASFRMLHGETAALRSFSEHATDRKDCLAKMKSYRICPLFNLMFAISFENKIVGTQQITRVSLYLKLASNHLT